MDRSFEGIGCVKQLLFGMRRRDLSSNSGFALGYDRVGEADDIHSFVEHRLGDRTAFLMASLVKTKAAKLLMNNSSTKECLLFAAHCAVVKTSGGFQQTHEAEGKGT